MWTRHQRSRLVTSRSPRGSILLRLLLAIPVGVAACSSSIEQPSAIAVSTPPASTFPPVTLQITTQSTALVVGEELVLLVTARDAGGRAVNNSSPGSPLTIPTSKS